MGVRGLVPDKMLRICYLKRRQMPSCIVRQKLCSNGIARSAMKCQLHFNKLTSRSFPGVLFYFPGLYTRK